MSADSRNVRGRCAIFAHGHVGYECATFVLTHYRKQVQVIVTVEENEISRLARSFACPTAEWASLTEDSARHVLDGTDYFFLAWWPRILPKFLLALPRIGAVNIHPSFLPFDRGKHYNFWTLVENTPFGVSLHFADEGIDTGDIVFQTRIAKSWQDTGETLHKKAASASIALFKERYVDVMQGNYLRIPQDPATGTSHLARELEVASELFLDRTYTARELLNLLRARTYEGHPACYFWDDGTKYEVRVSIVARND